MRQVILIAALSLLAGCATQQAWVHPTTGQANLASDRYRCEQDAARMFPPLYGQKPTTPSQPPTYSTNCRNVNGQIQCDTRQNPSYVGIGTALANYNASQDQNEGRRKSATSSCLSSMGYQYTTIGGYSDNFRNPEIESWERQQAARRAARTLVSEKQSDRERTCYYNINGSQVVRTVPISRDCPWQPE